MSYTPCRIVQVNFQKNGHKGVGKRRRQTYVESSVPVVSMCNVHPCFKNELIHDNASLYSHINHVRVEKTVIEYKQVLVDAHNLKIEKNRKEN